jgi:hypothetical protein
LRRSYYSREALIPSEMDQNGGVPSMSQIEVVQSSQSRCDGDCRVYSSGGGPPQREGKQCVMKNWSHNPSKWKLEVIEVLPSWLCCVEWGALIAEYHSKVLI